MLAGIRGVSKGSLEHCIQYVYMFIYMNLSLEIGNYAFDYEKEKRGFKGERQEDTVTYVI